MAVFTRYKIITQESYESRGYISSALSLHYEVKIIMKICEGFEIVNITDEYLIVPVGKMAEKFRGVVVINEATAFLLSNMKTDTDIENLVSLMVKNYDVEAERVCEDIEKIKLKLINMGIIQE